MRRQDDILYDLPVPVPEQQSNRVSFSSSNSGQANQANGDIYNRMYADRDYLYLAATTQILEGTMVYGYKGEDLNLTCMVNHNYDRRPNHVIWYHQNDIVAYEQLRKRDRSPLNSITSYHLIRNVDFDDAGNYTCAPDIYTSASTIVHILDGKDQDYQLRVLLFFLSLCNQFHPPSPLSPGDEMQSAKSNAASAFGTLPVTTMTALAWTTAFGLLCILYCHPDNAR